jgi:hypothetical protein
MGRLNAFKKSAGSQGVLRGAKVVAAGSVCYFVAAFLYIALSRMGYKFTLEWLEGASLIQVQRLLSGQPLYARPTFDYVALIYSPLYFYVASLLARLIGFGFLPLRLVSFCSTLGCVGLIYLIVKRYTADQFSSLMAAGSFLALYRISDTWFDLARVDMLAVFLALLAIYLVQAGSALRLILAGVSISLACLTKQTFWILVVPILLYALFLHGRTATFMTLTTLIVSVAAHLFLDRIYQGWYSFFVYSAGFGTGSSIMAGGLLHFFQAYWIDAVFQTVPILFLLFALQFVVRVRNWRSNLGLLALSGGMIVLSWLGILNKGGYNNVLITSYAIFLICAWLFIGGVLQDMHASNLARTGLLVIYSVQLAYLLYPVAPQIPTQEDYQTGQALLQDIRDQPGDVYIPFDNYLALYADKKPFAGFGALGDLNQLARGIARQEWNSTSSQLREMIKSRDFSLIILDENADWGSTDRYFQSYYQPTQIQYRQEAFFPVAGWQIRPKIRYTPISAN